MQYAQSLSTMRPAIMPAHPPGLMTFMPTARARLDPGVDVFGDGRGRQTEQDPSARAQGERWAGLLPWQVKRVRDYIDADLHGAMSLRAAAAHAHLSPGYFSRRFRQSFGVTFSRFVAARRVERARGLLAGGAGKLCEIALACGFADQAHFTRTFGTIMGCAPGRWRRQAAASRLSAQPAARAARAASPYWKS
jgi:AraC-like DNA-binding protein